MLFQLTPAAHNYLAQNVTCAKVETPCSTVIVYVFPVLREAVSFTFTTPVHFFSLGAQKISVK